MAEDSKTMFSFACFGGTFSQMEFVRFTMTENDAGRRIDRIARRLLPGLSLSSVYKLLRKGLIRLDGKKVAPETRCAVSSSLEIEIGAVKESSAAKPKTERPPPQNAGRHENPPPRFESMLILKTEDLVFLNKPAGIAVHGRHSLCALLPAEESAENSLSFKTGPLHRLDKNTTGIIAFSRTLKGARWFSENIGKKTIGKLYFGIIAGSRRTGEAEKWIDVFQSESGGERTAETDFLPVASRAGKTLALFRIHTGLKHQIRKQAALRHIPLYGDIRYNVNVRERGNDAGARGGYFLHAARMIFPEDRLDGLPEDISAPFPRRFEEAVETFFGENILADMRSATYTFNG